MSKFIELTHLGRPECFNIDLIVTFHAYTDKTRLILAKNKDEAITVKESYDEVKKKIESAGNSPFDCGTF